MTKKDACCGNCLWYNGDLTDKQSFCDDREDYVSVDHFCYKYTREDYFDEKKQGNKISREKAISTLRGMYRVCTVDSLDCTLLTERNNKTIDKAIADIEKCEKLEKENAELKEKIKKLESELRWSQDEYQMGR